MSKAEFRRSIRQIPVQALLDRLGTDWGQPLVDWLSNKSGTWGAFTPLPDELPVAALIPRLSRLTWVYPRATDNGGLDFHQLDKKGWVQGRYTQEPHPGSPKMENAKIEGLLIPALAIDHRGHRLGRGGGYYDRFLNSYSGIKIAVVPSIRFVPEVPIEPHDCVVDAVATESQLIWFREVAVGGNSGLKSQS